MKPILIAITGGSHAGKTVLINELRTRGYSTFSESGQEVLGELNQKYGLEGQKQWKLAHRFEYYEMICRKQAEKEKGPFTNELHFFDRTLIDQIAYFRVNGFTPPEWAMKKGWDLRPQRAFLMEIVTPFNIRPEEGKMTDYAYALRLQEELQKVYAEYQIPLVMVPVLPVEKRIEFILNEITHNEVGVV